MSPAARRASSTRKPSSEPVVITGPPRQLSVVLPPEGAPRLDPQAPIEASLDGARIDAIWIAAPRRSDPSGPRIKLRVDPLTPPGRYEGTATVGKLKVPIVAEVEARVAVRHTPAVIELDVAPAAHADVTVTLQNLSNVHTDVPDVSTFVLLDRSGFGDAFYHSISAPPPEGKQRVDVFFDDLAASNGGEVTATATGRDGTWPLAPGETGAVTVRFAFSDRLRPGAQYAGAWNIDATHVPVRVTVPPAAVDAPAPQNAPARPRRADTTTKPRATRRKEAPPS